MFKFIGRMFEEASYNSQKKEILYFIDMLSGMDSDELGAILLHVAASRRRLNIHYNIDLNNPWIYLEGMRDLILKFHAIRGGLQKEGAMPQAAAMAVWIHTLRCVRDVALRVHGKRMWDELMRGEGYVYAALCSDFGEMANIRPHEIEDFHKRPDGF